MKRFAKLTVQQSGACCKGGRSYGDQPKMHWSEKTDGECCRTFALRVCGIGAMNPLLNIPWMNGETEDDDIYVSITADFLRPFPAEPSPNVCVCA